MSRLAGFYIAKAIESAAGSPTAAAASRVPPRRTRDNAAIRTHDRNPAVFQRAAAAVHHIIGGLRRSPGAAGDRTTSGFPCESPRGNHQHPRAARTSRAQAK
jgi:hypothetical protein